MTDQPLNHSKPTPRGRRGSIYAVVLAMAILVSLIGLSAVAVGRINLRSASGVGDSASAELLGLSAIEHGIAALNSEAGWRSNTTYFTEQKTPAIRLGTGSFCWKLRDELDGDIQKTVGGIQPVRLFGIGSVGEAKRVYSVVLVPTGTNLLANPGFESGTTPFVADAGACVLEVVSTDVRNGLRSLSVKSRVSKDAGPLQDMTAKLTDNKWYYLEAWVKMSTTPEEPVMTLVLRKSGSNDRFIRRPATQTAQKAGIEWTKIGYSFKTELNSGGSFDNAYWRIETASTTQDFKVDDVKLIEETGASTPMPMAPARETWKQEQGE